MPRKRETGWTFFFAGAALVADSVASDSGRLEAAGFVSFFDVGIENRKADFRRILAKDPHKSNAPGHVFFYKVVVVAGTG